MPVTRSLAIQILAILLLLSQSSSAQLFNALVSSRAVESSFTGSPLPFFTLTAATKYDNGGQGIGYNVPSPGCFASSCAAGSTTYRPDAVNFKASTFGTGFPYQLGFNGSPDKYCYTIAISQAGPYIVTLWLADTSSGGSWQVSIDGQSVGNVITPNTGSFSTFAASASPSFNATTGTHVMCLSWASGDAFFSVAGDIVAWQGSQAGAGTPCTIGPNYTGTIPAGAQAAGFTQCVANFDFTSTANFTYNGHTYNFSNTATWLSCNQPGGTTSSNGNPALLFNTGYFPNPTPCSDFNIISHGGTNVLDITYTIADAQAGNEMSWIITGGPNTGGGSCNTSCTFTVPNGHYTDITVATNTQTATWGYHDGTQHDSVSYFSGFANNAQYYMEWDVTENFINDQPPPFGMTGSGGCIFWRPGQPNDYACGAAHTDWQVSSPGLDYTAFQTFGQLTTSDGTTNLGACSYLNNQKTWCMGAYSLGAGTPVFNTRYYYGFGVGDQNRSPPTIPVNNLDMYVKSITYWEPPNCTWQTSQCNTSPVVSQ